MSHPLLTAPIGSSLWRLAAPTTAVMMVQTVVAIAETYFFGRLGTDALAGFALVFPFMMLMQMMAAGGMGGGVASAMARALGGKRIEDARALVLHALVLGAAFSVLFTVLAWTIAPTFYRLLGGSGAALANAEIYSHVLFSGSVAIWANFFFSALLRGGGDAATPGRYMLIFSILQVPLSGALALGVGSWPGMGVAGPAVSMVVTMGAAALLQARALWRGKLGFVPALTGIPLEGRLFREILRVGLIASVLPEGWARLFTDDPQVVAATVSYITHVAPFYCLFALGMTLNFACQGAGRMMAPLVAGVSRLVLATSGGWYAAERLGLGLDGVFTAIAVAMIVYGLMVAVPLLMKPWGPKRARLAPTTGASDGPTLDDRHLEPQPR